MRIFANPMSAHVKYLVIVMIGFLFTKDVALVICSTDNPLYWMENVEENEQSDTKEKQEKKETDDKKLTLAIHTLISNSLSLSALHIVSERKYCAPSFDVVSPPPELA